MKLIHTSDLHLGKKIQNQDRTDEQWNMLTQMLDYAKANQVQGIIIAGDVFDSVNPGFEALGTLDDLLTNAATDHIHLYIIAGNHDSSLRLRYGSRLFKEKNIHIVTDYKGSVEYLDLENPEGKPVRLHLLPFIRPIDVAKSLEIKVDDYESMFDLVMETVKNPKDRINILVAHQYFAGAERSEGEFELGNIDRISTRHLKNFDYCALGHVHKPQEVGDKGYYPGSILKYSSDEAGQQKSFNVLTITDHVSCERVNLKAKKEIEEVEGFFSDLISRSFYKNLNREQYYKFVLLDEEQIPMVFPQLMSIYPNMLEVTYKKKFHDEIQGPKFKAVSGKSPTEMIEHFYGELQDEELTDYQKDLIYSIWEDINAAH